MDTIDPSTTSPATTRRDDSRTTNALRRRPNPGPEYANNEGTSSASTVGQNASPGGESYWEENLDSVNPDNASSDPSTTTTSTVLWLTRLAFVVALAITVAFPEWEQFAGKGMAFRVPFYALPMGIVPLVWKARGSHGEYPWLVDLLVFSPFFVDTLGNVFNFYNNFNQTDDVLHFANWVLLMGGITIGFGRLKLGKLVAWTLGWGLGALAIIWWEVAEFLVQEMGTAGLSLTYQDTVGDLVLSSTGGAVGAFLAVTFAWPSSARRETPSPS